VVMTLTGICFLPGSIIYTPAQAYPLYSNFINGRSPNSVFSIAYNWLS